MYAYNITYTTRLACQPTLLNLLTILSEQLVNKSWGEVLFMYFSPLLYYRYFSLLGQSLFSNTLS
jgi:hypothetical protein